MAQAQLLPPVIPAFCMPTLRVGALLLAGGAVTPAFVGQVSAEQARSGHADLARQLAEEISAAPADETLDGWSRAVVERALERVAEHTRPTPDNAGTAAPRMFRRPAGTVGSKGAPSAEVLVFTSLAVPAASWRAAARDAARIGAPLVLRGVAEGSLPGTARRIAGRLGDVQVGVAIDPRLFHLFGIARVPAVVVVPGGVPPCRTRGCADDDPPPFDRVVGNLSLAAALEAIATEGSEGRAIARRHLATLRRAER